jgi:phospho-N-acetylmuramoyl-pentapeptide-transferase
MLYHLFDQIGALSLDRGLFNFISFRAAMAVFVSLLISLWWGKGIINLLASHAGGRDRA